MINNDFHSINGIGAYLRSCQCLDFYRCRNDDDADWDGETKS